MEAEGPAKEADFRCSLGEYGDTGLLEECVARSLSRVHEVHEVSGRFQVLSPQLSQFCSDVINNAWTHLSVTPLHLEHDMVPLAMWED